MTEVVDVLVFVHVAVIGMSYGATDYEADRLEACPTLGLEGSVCCAEFS